MNVPERNDKGELPTYAWPGGYPIFYVTADNGVLCASDECANGPEARDTDADDQWRIVAADIHYEGAQLVCDHCNGTIDSAYGDPNKRGEK